MAVVIIFTITIRFFTAIVVNADPQAMAVDAFTLNWNFSLIYAFPPFSPIAPVLKKIQEDQAEVIMVVPKWTHSHGTHR